MALAKGRQAAIETAKAECLRRWPELNLRAEARRYKGRIEGYVVFKSNTPNIIIAGERFASEAWSTCLCVLESEPEKLT